MLPCRVRSPTVPRPYSEQEPLELSEQDVDVVLTVVCGDAADGAAGAEVRNVTFLLWTSSTTVAVRADCAHLRAIEQAKATGAVNNVATVSSSPSDCQVAMSSPCKTHMSILRPGAVHISKGVHRSRLAVQMCCAVLIKLLLDTWTRAGAATAFPIALLVLSRAAGSAVAAARVRAYDLLLNLSAHAELLHSVSSSAGHPLGSTDEPHITAESTADADPVDGQAGSHATNSNVTDAQEVVGLDQWLHHLLLRLLEQSLKVHMTFRDASHHASYSACHWAVMSRAFVMFSMKTMTIECMPGRRG